MLFLGLLLIDGPLSLEYSTGSMREQGAPQLRGAPNA